MPDLLSGVDALAKWRSLVAERESRPGSHSDPKYWDRRAATFARSTRTRVDQFLDVLAPYCGPRKTLIDVGAGAGRHAVPLADRLEWVTAVEPSEGMRALIAHRDNMTVVASDWADAVVAPADLVICCHVMYGVSDPQPFIEKLEASARERVFIMIREGPIPHPAEEIRRRTQRLVPRMPQFSDLFLVLMQMGIAPDVSFMRYPTVHRFADMDEAVADCRMHLDHPIDEALVRSILEEILVKDGDELLFDGGVTLSGVAHWHPRTTS
jgi:SAM-dependent methyltransferase